MKVRVTLDFVADILDESTLPMIQPLDAAVAVLVDAGVRFPVDVMPGARIKIGRARRGIAAKPGFRKATRR